MTKDNLTKIPGPNFFGYQTRPQYINTTPGLLRLDHIDYSPDYFKTKTGDVVVKLQKDGVLLFDFCFSDFYPALPDKLYYYATLNDVIIPGSIVESDTSGSSQGIETRTHTTSVSVKKGDIFKAYSYSTSGALETTIPMITIGLDTFRKDGGFSLRMFYLNQQPV